ncbi:hypothetical protein PHMEG_00025104, partial [Phytophthora megakarya]
MTSPQLLHAAIRSDGEVREAPYTLLCMVAAVEKVSALIEGDVMELYLNEMDVSPLERVLHSADEFSLQKNATRDKYKLKRKLKAQEDAPPQASSIIALNIFELRCSKDLKSSLKVSDTSKPVNSQVFNSPNTSRSRNSRKIHSSFVVTYVVSLKFG